MNQTESIATSSEVAEIPEIPSQVSDDTKSERDLTLLTIDEVIENYVGSFGYSQIIQAFLVSLAWMFDAQIALVTIFSDAEPHKWRCKENNTCHGRSVCELRPGSWEWVEGHKSSVIAEWGLICHHKFLAALPGSSFFLGSLIGSAIYGRLADSYLGRRKTLMLACLITSITAFVTSLSPNIWAYTTFRFLNGLTRSGIGTVCLVLATETVGKKWRGQVGQYGFFFFTLGFLSLSPIAYYSKSNWRHLYYTISGLIVLYTIIVLPFVLESPHWLLVKGRKAEALLILTKVGARNGREIPPEIELMDPSENEDDGGARMSLWECKWARMRMVKAMLVAFGAGFVYYAFQLNVENLNFNKYLSVAINALMEIPAVFIGSFLLGFMKRRVLLLGSCLLTGIACFICIIFSKDKGDTLKSSIQLGFEAIGFIGASLAFDLMFIYCVELFPTNVRNLAVSLTSQALVLGGAIAPYLVILGRLSPTFSFIVIGGLAILSGLISLWLPETKNATLFETLEQQELEEKLGHSSASSHDQSMLELGETRS